MYKTIGQVRKAFWQSVPQHQSEYKARKRQNEYHTDIRCSFVDFVDYLERDSLISNTLANKVTL